MKAPVHPADLARIQRAETIALEAFEEAIKENFPDDKVVARAATHRNSAQDLIVAYRIEIENLESTMAYVAAKAKEAVGDPD